MRHCTITITYSSHFNNTEVKTCVLYTFCCISMYMYCKSSTFKQFYSSILWGVLFCIKDKTLFSLEIGQPKLNSLTLSECCTFILGVHVCSFNLKNSDNLMQNLNTCTIHLQTWGKSMWKVSHSAYRKYIHELDMYSYL